MTSTDASGSAPAAPKGGPADGRRPATGEGALGGIDRPLPIRRLLIALQIMAAVCMLVSAVQNWGLALYGDRAGAEIYLLIGDLHFIQSVVVAVLWLLRGRRRSARSRLIISVLGVLALMPLLMVGRVSDAGFMIPALLVAFALVVLDGGLRVVIVLLVLDSFIGIGLHLSANPNPIELLIGLTNTLPVLVLLLIGVVLGAALAAYEQGRRSDERTIAERDHALSRLEAAMERLRSQAQTEKELMLADERARSARELHDGLGHRLTLISMSLDYARRMREKDEAAAWSEVDTAAETSADALTEMRTWVRALSPVRDLDATGTAAIDAIAESFRGTGIDVALARSGPEPQLDEETSLLLYRTVQEGLTNALRHGRARTVRIEVDSGEVLRLALTSDLDEAARQAVPRGMLEPGFGLRGIAERARALGGRTEARREGDDVVLTVEVPLTRTGAAGGAPSAPASPHPEESR